MPTPELFLQATVWMGIATLAAAALTGLAFVLKWGWRFRLVGVTSFCGVLTAGLFGLSFEPFTPSTVVGSVPYKTVFDSGAAQVVIKVPPSITEPQLQATLQQAGQNLFRASRLNGIGQVPTIRARTILHPTNGVSELLYLGQVQPIPDASTGNPMTVTIDAKLLAKVQAASGAA
jgi:Protein of function (DUF2518)